MSTHMHALAGMTARPTGKIEDRDQTDRVTTSTRAGLRRCRCPRPRHAARFSALARSRRRHSGNLLLRPLISTQDALLA